MSAPDGTESGRVEPVWSKYQDRKKLINISIRRQFRLNSVSVFLRLHLDSNI